jgi:hypothetical protein
MPTTVQSIHHIPANAIRSQLQADGTVLVYLPGDTLPPPPPSGPPPVPSEVTPRQFYLALMQLGWFGTTEAAIDGYVMNFLNTQVPEPPREMARVSWNKSTMFLRANPMLIAMAPAVGKTPADLDQLFALAATFPAT